MSDLDGTLPLTGLRRELGADRLICFGDNHSQSPPRQRLADEAGHQFRSASCRRAACRVR